MSIPLIPGVSEEFADSVSKSVNVTEYGAVGDGTTDDTAAIEAAVSEQQALGGSVVFPPGTYSVSAGLSFTLTRSLSVVLQEGAVLRRASGDDPVLSINGSASRYGFKMSGGEIDSSLTTFGPGQTGTCLELVNVDEFYVDRVKFYAGDDWVNNTAGDSGITTVDCRRGSIVSCHFQGHPDAAIYVSGNNIGGDDDGGEVSIIGCHFYRNALGFTAKRSHPRVTVTANTFIENRVGVAMLEADTSALPGRDSVISSNTFKFTESRAIELKMNPGCVVVGNVIEDIGYDRSGVAVSGWGVRILGSQHNVVSSNVIRMNEWANHANVFALRSADTTFDSTTYNAGNNLFSGNRIEGVENGIIETGATLPSHYSDILLTNVSLQLSGLVSTTFVTLNNGSGQYRMFVGNTEMSRVNNNSVFVRGLRFFDSATASGTPANFSADRYISVIDSTGTTRYLPVADSTW